MLYTIAISVICCGSDGGGGGMEVGNGICEWQIKCFRFRWIVFNIQFMWIATSILYTHSIWDQFKVLSILLCACFCTEIVHLLIKHGIKATLKRKCCFPNSTICNHNKGIKLKIPVGMFIRMHTLISVV